MAFGRRMRWVGYGGLIALFLYEFYAIGSSARGDTISEVVWRISERPLVPFAFGLLMGHFFWPRRITVN